MSKATLVIMAAGIGSRFGGGIKQLEPVGPNGEIIMDYSIYDAMEAGFDKVVFVIRKNLEKDFKEIIGNRISKIVEVAYAYQEVEEIPSQYKTRFQNRTKPWGTGQAILSCKDVIDAPFLVINADDYYGKEAYKKSFQYLTNPQHLNQNEICMISFILKNTLSDNGAVTRGICKVNEQGMLSDIVETKNIEKEMDYAIVRKADGSTEKLDLDSIVSMNMWGIYPEFIEVLEKGFEEFLSELEEGDQKSEYLLPTIIGNLLDKEEISVKVLKSVDKWFGVTYKEDKETVVAAIKELIDAGMYH